jgi:hypothetical protein
MKSKRNPPLDSDLEQATLALQRAAVQARRLSEETATPFYVFKVGRVLNLNHHTSGDLVIRERDPRE